MGGCAGCSVFLVLVIGVVLLFMFMGGSGQQGMGGQGQQQGGKQRIICIRCNGTKVYDKSLDPGGFNWFGRKSCKKCSGKGYIYGYPQQGRPLPGPGAVAVNSAPGACPAHPN